MPFVTSFPSGEVMLAAIEAFSPSKRVEGPTEIFGTEEPGGDVDLPEVAPGVVEARGLVVVPRVEHDGVEPGGGVRRDGQVAVYEREARPADLQRLRAGLVSGRETVSTLDPEGLTRVAVTFAPSAMVAPRVVPVERDWVR